MSSATRHRFMTAQWTYLNHRRVNSVRAQPGPVAVGQVVRQVAVAQVVRQVAVGQAVRQEVICTEVAAVVPL